MLKIDHVYIFYYECAKTFFNQTFGNVIINCNTHYNKEYKFSIFTLIPYMKSHK
jgi:hypothetical protein